MTKTYNWLGDAGQGGNGDWNTAADWQPGGPPPAFANVNFAVGGAYTVTGSSGAFYVENLSVAGTDNVTFSGITLQTGLSGIFSAAAGAYVTIDPTAVVNGLGALNFATGSVLEVQGNYYAGGPATADVVLVDGIGAYFAPAGLTANTLQVFDGGTIASDIVLSDGGTIKFDTTAFFGGTLTLVGNASVYEAAYAGTPSGTFGDSVAFQKAGGVLYLASDPGATLVLAGVVGTGSNTNGFLNITGGTVEIASGANPLSGGVVVDTGATLRIDAAGSAGTGGIFLADGTLDVEGAQTDQIVVAASGVDSIYGSAGGLTVYGSNASTLTFQGGANGSVVYGGTGTLYATGGSGGDTIFAGSSGHDVLITGTGPTTLAGGNADLIAVGGAANLLAAAGGNTTLNGSAATGNNVMFGATSGNTTIEGGFGHDTVVGLQGACTFYASQGINDVFAGAGTLQVDFVVGFGGGTTNVIGFNTATDHLHTVGLGANPVSSVSEVNGNTVITLNDHSTIVLWGVASLPTNAFV